MSASKDALLPGYSVEHGLVDPHVVDGTERNERLIREAWITYEQVKRLALRNSRRSARSHLLCAFTQICS
jgi:hypothetical protein